MFRLPALCCKHCITWLLSLTSLISSNPHISGLLEMLAVSWVSSPKTSHQVKYNPQLLGCDFFFKSADITLYFIEVEIKALV